MSHKIKIDLCEVFGVKEGQEFKIIHSEVKYKIENNVLMRSDSLKTFWVQSNLTLNWIALNVKEIEILKPETPPEIKKMLQAFYDMGFRIFYYESGSLCFDGGGKSQSFWINDELDEWAFSLFESIKPNKICEIKDYI